MYLAQLYLLEEEGESFLAPVQCSREYLEPLQRVVDMPIPFQHSGEYLIFYRPISETGRGYTCPACKQPGMYGTAEPYQVYGLLEGSAAMEYILSLAPAYSYASCPCGVRYYLQHQSLMYPGVRAWIRSLEALQQRLQEASHASAAD